MLPREKREILKRGKRKGYIPYVFIVLGLVFSFAYWFDLTVITLGIIYVLVHQGYYFHKFNELDEVKIGF